MSARIEITSVRPDTTGMGNYQPGEPGLQIGGTVYKLRYDMPVYVDLPPGPPCRLEVFLYGLHDEHMYKGTAMTQPLAEGSIQRFRYSVPVHGRLTWFNPFAKGLLEPIP